MATLKREGRNFRLTFSVPGRSRQRVRLGGMSDEMAERALHHVEVAIRAHKRQQPIAVQTLDWLFHSGPRRLLEALSAIGVVDDRRLLSDALRSWIISEKIGLSSKRVNQAERCVDSLLAYIRDVEVESVTAAKLADWRDRLLQELEQNTVSTYVQDCKQFFSWAVKQRLILSSPAAELPVIYEQSNRLREVPSELVTRLVEAAAGIDHELKIALLLARWGGLRAAEILRVNTADVRVDQRSIMVRDTKRAKHGHDRRVLPVFPELDPVLKQARRRSTESMAVAGRNALLLPELGSLTTSAMDQRAKRLCESIDIEPWERFWQNMRATRESELMDEFSLKDVCKWIGNSPKVAMDHYAMVRQVTFDRAIGDRRAG